MTIPRVLITGGTGLLALNWACTVRDTWDVVLGTHQHSVQLRKTSAVKLDLDDPVQFGHQIDALAPDLVVHTVGLTDVDRCEKEPDLARHSNAEIARNVAQAAAEKRIRMIHISTDHLYPGDHSYYQEHDAVQPINEYGRTKALAETWVQSTYPEALIVRTNFYCWGHSKRQSFSDWLINNFREGRSLTLFDDVYFTPILADGLVLASHELVDKGASGVINVAGSDRLSKYEFALLLAEEFGLSADLIRRAQLAQSKLSAPRPKDMSLDCRRAEKILGRRLGVVSESLKTLRRQEFEGRRQELLEAKFS